MPVTPANTGTVFARLDQDWTITCRRTRRTDTLARWTAQEPALGDLARLEDIAAPRKTIPAAHFGAILRLTIAGDTTAARTLLQMIRPGLVRITRELRSPHHTHLAGDVVTAALGLHPPSATRHRHRPHRQLPASLHPPRHPARPARPPPRPRPRHRDHGLHECPAALHDTATRHTIRRHASVGRRR